MLMEENNQQFDYKMQFGTEKQILKHVLSKVLGFLRRIMLGKTRLEKSQMIYRSKEKSKIKRKIPTILVVQ